MDVRAVLLALLIVLAGCNSLFGPSQSGGPTDATSTETGTAAGTQTDFPTVEPADPPADRLGWEGGVWYNETIAVDNDDGLNDSELELVVNRTMARIERLRGLEYAEPVPIEIIDRDDLADRLSRNHTETFRQFDNAKFEAMFLVGTDTDSLAVQEANRGESILGFYDVQNDSMVLVSDTGRPQLQGRGTLAHELVHALQDEHFNLSSYSSPTRDAYAGSNGVIEGEANFIQRQYMDRCETEWPCVQPPENASQSGPPADFHYGIYFLDFFPYSEGEVFVHDVNASGGLSAVDALYEDFPESAEQVIYPERYGSDPPVAVEIADANGAGWERVRPDPPREGTSRPDYAVLGQSGLSAMFAHTFSSRLSPDGYGSYNDSMVVQPTTMINSLAVRDSSREYVSYDLAYTNGWEGDRLHAYARDGEIGYVWRIAWENESEAREFLRGYRRVLAHWGGDRVGEGTWEIAEDSPFTGAISIQRDGDAVTIVKAPTVDQLGQVYEGAGP